MSSMEIRRVLDALPLPVFAKAADHSWIYGNQAFADLIGLDDFIGRDDTTLFNEEQVDIFWREDDLVLGGETSTSFEEIGEGTFALTRKFPITLEDGKPGLLGMIIEAVASPEDLRKTRSDFKSAQAQSNLLLSQLQSKADGHARQYEQRLRNLERERETAQSLAHTDPLTKVRNRLGFQADLQSLSKRCDKMSGSFTLVFIDLDDFKHINDTFGHQMGDRVLCQVADRFNSLGPIFSVSRLGGDEFAVLLECGGQPTHEVKERLRGMADLVFRPVTDFKREVDASGSLGYTRYPFDTKNLSELKRYADLALMKAKKVGKGQSENSRRPTIPTTCGCGSLKRASGPRSTGRISRSCTSRFSTRARAISRGWKCWPAGRTRRSASFPRKNSSLSPDGWACWCMSTRLCSNGPAASWARSSIAAASNISRSMRVPVMSPRWDMPRIFWPRCANIGLIPARS